MGHVPLLDELAFVAALAVLVTVVLAKVKLPTVTGLLVAGALVGPFGFRAATSVKAIEVLAEVGVVLLLFTIGLEFSLARLRDIFRRVALGGAIQVGLTLAVTTERVVATVRRVAPEVPVIMRTRYLLERERLLLLGAKEVVAEEVEGAVEIRPHAANAGRLSS